MRWSTIQLILELLRQFKRSLVNSESQTNRTRAGREGFVYVIRERANGERFKTGYRAKPPWRDSQLRSQMGQSQDFVLIIPAKDASSLEQRLRRTYGKRSKKGEWFELDKSELREILIIAALVMVVAGDTIGMVPVDDEIRELGKRLFTHVKALASAMWANTQSSPTQSPKEDGASVNELILDSFSAIPNVNWEWESVLDEDYRVLPKLKGKSGYVCIIRDTETDNYKVYFEDHPVDAIDCAFLETGLRFPLEIFLVLEIENKKKAKEALLSLSESKHRNEWVNLSMEELGEIKRSSTEAYAHSSVYVNPKKHWGLETLSCDVYKDYPKLEKPVGYVCVVQGVKPGKHRKIWKTRHPKRLAKDKKLALMLNNPHDVLTSSEPIRLKWIIKSEHAESFQTFLHKRYRKHRTKGGWFKLDEAQLREIRNLGKQ